MFHGDLFLSGVVDSRTITAENELRAVMHRAAPDTSDGFLSLASPLMIGEEAKSDLTTIRTQHATICSQIGMNIRSRREIEKEVPSSSRKTRQKSGPEAEQRSGILLLAKLSAHGFLGRELPSRRERAQWIGQTATPR
jgi:hypothetical protein